MSAQSSSPTEHASKQDTRLEQAASLVQALTSLPQAPSGCWAAVAQTMQGSPASAFPMPPELLVAGGGVRTEPEVPLVTAEGVEPEVDAVEVEVAVAVDAAPVLPDDVVVSEDDATVLVVTCGATPGTNTEK